MGLIGLLIVLLAIVALVLKKKSPGSGHKKTAPASLNAPEQPWPFYARKPLSPPEQVLYFRLIQALPAQIVLAQVGLSRLLGVKKGHDFNQWFNRISRMSVDFVVCNKDSSILAVIELDDASHARPDRQAADAKKDQALAAAGIRILRWQVQSLPDVAQIQQQLGLTNPGNQANQPAA